MRDDAIQHECENTFCDNLVDYMQPKCQVCNRSQDWSEFWPSNCPHCNKFLIFNSTNKCPQCNAVVSCWPELASHIMSYGPHCDVCVDKEAVIHPSQLSNFSGGIGIGDDQTSDYRWPLNEGGEIHVKEFDDFYKVHYDEVSAKQNPVGHLMRDAPGVALSLGVVALCGCAIFSE